jgi:5-azacytidine-induced protein 1
MEQEEQAYQQQRRRLYSELQEEKERISTQAQRQRQGMDETIAELQVIYGARHFTTSNYLF